ncbi:hypothetical protein ACCS87_02590 [Rhizobium ruizarguesonis]|uniref:hypothetical protein n=1 Tax=Rhizobium leguminosarum TaxID=384 RepID=UPI0010402B34|nr:hypothetical protein [Rhizobium leguminosarum]MBY5503152.1 hypothetical protein [Rhizobium leguminosarum]NKK31570.1 hypothetical protein [Rhizobium leguminosarum bv. viciae]TBZ45492.1 hypothetical protein E0H42_30525 [Rhizobium leguminosarum bv. viciae]
MTPEQLMGAILFFVTLLGAISGVWWRIEGRVDRAKAEAVQKATEAATEAASVRADLAAHKLHAAETFITKQGMRESTESIMEAIHGVKAAVDHMTMRVDRIVENQVKRPTTRA